MAGGLFASDTHEFLRLGGESMVEVASAVAQMDRLRQGMRHDMRHDRAKSFERLRGLSSASLSDDGR